MHASGIYTLRSDIKSIYDRFRVHTKSEAVAQALRDRVL
jgi:DNA-binding CsgD family transcriptional regulator